ncbi:unnamed protein product [Larinioides sclopetarius]|uniref:Uncharacterized protein n=1 Tax=Larinioides sclopetarius TaxID=280406 RepID=A0AAV2B1T4_9ARAC
MIKLGFLNLLEVGHSMMIATSKSLFRWIDIIGNPVNLSSPIINHSVKEMEYFYKKAPCFLDVAEQQFLSSAKISKSEAIL